MINLFLDKLIGVDYHSAYRIDTEYIYDVSAKVIRTSANLNHVKARIIIMRPWKKRIIMDIQK